MSNKLKIDAQQIKLEFRGSKEDIRRGYEMTRELLIMHFHEQLARAEVKEQKKKSTRSWTPPQTQETMHISVAISSDFYNKVCVLEREDYEDSIFNSVMRFDTIDRIYIRSSQKDALQRHIKIGKVLWRELTPTGKAAVRS